MSNEIKLVYFDIRGLGEPIRLILKYANVDFIDERVTFEQWSSLKPKTRNGKLPYLEYDGHEIVESYAIERFLARKYNLAGKDEFEAALVDSIADIQKDFYKLVLPWLRAARGFSFSMASSSSGYIKQNPDDLKKEHLDEPCKTYFPIFSKYLKESNSGFMAPSGLTWVDFVITEFFTTLIQKYPDTLDNYRDLKEYLERVHQIPQLKDYYSQRPNTY